MYVLRRQWRIVVPPMVLIGGGNPVTALCNKLQLHRDYVTFLVQTGAYRRVSTVGKVHLRDHGELITAPRALLIKCLGCFSKADAALGEEGQGRGRDHGSRPNELVQARQMFMTAL